MISSNAKTIQKSFTEQAKNFETKSMNFTKQEYLEHIISCVKPQKTDTVLKGISPRAARYRTSDRSLLTFRQIFPFVSPTQYEEEYYAALDEKAKALAGYPNSKKACLICIFS